MLPPTKILSTSLVKAVIAEGCILNADLIKHSVIGIRSRIGNGTSVENTYIMGSDRYQTLAEIEEENAAGRPLIGIGDRCKIFNAIVDKNCRIGNDVTINGGEHLEDGDFECYAVKDGIVVVKKDAVIVNGTVIG